MTDWMRQIREDIDRAFREQVLAGHLEAVMGRDKYGSDIGVIFREPVLYVPCRKGTWTENSFIAYDVLTEGEPVEIPGRVGVWRLTEVFLQARYPLEWDGTQWVDGPWDPLARYVAVRVVPWEEPKAAPEPAVLPNLKVECKPYRAALTVSAEEFERAARDMPDYAAILRDEIAAGIKAEEKRREQALLDAIQRGV